MKIIITNTTGRNIIEINNEIIVDKIDISGLYKGLYIIRFYQGNKLIS